VFNFLGRIVIGLIGWTVLWVLLLIAGAILSAVTGTFDKQTGETTVDQSVSPTEEQNVSSPVGPFGYDDEGDENPDGGLPPMPAPF
jgi:hypothetical protein